MTKEQIRLDWIGALESETDFSDIAKIIEYKLEMQDLFILGEIHENFAQYREKIQDLLFECMYYYECKLLKEEGYPTYSWWCAFNYK